MLTLQTSIRPKGGDHKPTLWDPQVESSGACSHELAWRLKTWQRTERPRAPKGPLHQGWPPLVARLGAHSRSCPGRAVSPSEPERWCDCECTGALKDQGSSSSPGGLSPRWSGRRGLQRRATSLWLNELLPLRAGPTPRWSLLDCRS